VRREGLVLAQRGRSAAGEERLIVASGSMEPVSREQLYELVWKQPMLRVAKQFGVSSSYMARVCSLLHVPRPERGYWAKLAAAKPVKQPVLPDARPGDPIAWARDGAEPPIMRARPVAPLRRTVRGAPRTAVSPHTEHELVRGVKAHFLSGSTSRSDAGYLKPLKKMLTHIVATTSGLDVALTFANRLYLALEARGYSVVLAPAHAELYGTTIDPREEARGHSIDLWSPRRGTVTYIGTVAIGLAIAEMSEEAEAKYVDGKYVRLSELPQKRRRSPWPDGWVAKHDFPTGRLLLKAFSPYRQAEWSKEWREKKAGDLLASVESVVDTLEAAAPVIQALYVEGEAAEKLELERRVAEYERWEREDRERRRREAVERSAADLRRVIADWDESVRTQALFRAIEAQVDAAPNGSAIDLRERLARAKELVGETDAVARLRAWETPEERLERRR
jgi:hypothetical protein